MSVPDRDPVNARELGRAVRELNDNDEAIRLEGLNRLQRVINRAASMLCGIGCPENIAEDRRLNEATIKIASQPDIASLLLRALDDPVLKLRSQATIPAWNARTAEVEAAFIRHLLTDPVPHMRTMCSVGLAHWETPEAFAAMTEALGDSEHKVVSSACQALTGSGYVAAIEPLRAVLAHPDWSARFNACEALLSLNAADERLIIVLEKLAGELEAAEYDEMVTTYDESEVDYMGDELRRPPTVGEVLDGARQKLCGG